ncbi:hypothetical protein ACFU5O_16985 [Streptomyces sp. NPDC057445]|uniref:hypothetical protein n=1 Tax=Streptomyces sp. NPDC057445 TaxID=3346136 RepID=UPI0036A5EECF
MTSSTGTTQHPDVSEISDLTEGLLPPSRQTAVRQHLDGCPLCTDVQASLEEIRGLLGSLPGPTRMPSDVAGRIDAALAAEALLNATAPEEEPVDVSRETSTTAQQSESAPGDRPAGRPRATTGPGRSRPARRRRTAVLGAAFGAAAVGVSVLLLQSIGTGSDEAQKSESGVSASDTSDFSESRLESRVRTLLTPDTGLPEASPGGTKPQPRTDRETSLGIEASPNSPLRTPNAAVPACVQRGIGRTEQALAVDQGTYAGTRAYLVVLPHSSDGSRVQAYVVDAKCVDTAPNGKGELLLTRAYHRP